MKKSLIALAVVGAFAGAASAQSNVTLYGIADIGIGMQDRGSGLTITGLNPITTAPVSSDSVVAVFSGVQSTSRFGIRGSEDLGGGLKAIFNMEAGVQYDTGNSDSTFFQRRTIVGLGTGFGEFRLGRDYTPGFSAAGATDVMGYGLFGNWLTFTTQGLNSQAFSAVTGANPGDSAAFSGLLAGIDTRANNGLYYTSPAFGNTKCAMVPAPTECGIFSGGLTVTAMYASGENDGANAVSGVGDTYGGAIVYRGGPMTLQGYYQTREFDNLNNGTGDKDQYGVGFQYVFGQFRVAGNWGVVEADSNRGVAAEKEAFGIGAGMKLGAGEFLVNFITQEISSNATNITPESDSWGIAYVHPMSKRTNLYATYGRTTNNNYASTGINYSGSSVSAVGLNGNAQGFAVGVRHLF